MSRIAPVNPAETQGQVRTLLDGVKQAHGAVINLFKVAAQSPTSLQAMLGLFGALESGTLGQSLGEQIAIAVADANGCDYCLSAHTAVGRKAGLSAAELTAARDAHSADARTQAALTFAAKVNATHGQVDDADLAAVRAAGFSDGEIVELVTHVAVNVFTNMVNNVARTDIEFPVLHAAHKRAA